MWVSQARSVENGPPRGVPATTPDRVPYDLLKHEHWPTAIPVGLAELASVEGVDPVQAYGVFVAVAAGLLALAVFFAARGCLHWSARRSAVARGDRHVQRSSAAQLVLRLAGTDADDERRNAASFSRSHSVSSGGRALATAFCPRCSEHRRSRTYGWTVAPFVVIGAVVSVACVRAAVGFGLDSPPLRRPARLRSRCSPAPSEPSRSRERRITLVNGSQHASAIASSASGISTRGRLRPMRWVWSRVVQRMSECRVGGAGNRGGCGHPCCRDSLCRLCTGTRAVTCSSSRALTIVAELGRLGTGSSPYASLKLMAYSTPLLTLLALGPRRRQQPPSETRTSCPTGRCWRAAPSICSRATTVNSMAIGLQDTHPATEVRPAARAAEGLPRHKVIQLAVDDASDQVWLAYFLRDRPLAVRHPSIVFTGYSARDAASAQVFDVPADFVIPRSPCPLATSRTSTRVDSRLCDLLAPPLI